MRRIIEDLLSFTNSSTTETSRSPYDLWSILLDIEGLYTHDYLNNRLVRVEISNRKILSFTKKDVIFNNFFNSMMLNHENLYF